MQLSEALGPAVWDVQENGRVLCPQSGVRLSFSQEGTRASLELDSGHRTMFDPSRGGLVMRPAVAREDELTLRAVTERDLRDDRVVAEAFSALRAFGAQAGVFIPWDWRSLNALTHIV
ncbi:hypothetical protein [Deinococcus hohokamensis]|uniref:Uncharacterized protein n=1 Tax=Deinococcus hohokamensis TaxID=309883 RepID=A0ABV9I795_9DEIO